ncbi:hypothetical protein SAMN04489730_4494 [Amycolatopsis australiensis]|uniref:Uncharacterized protein n=1 Tax=Amycolatopsis australiensis TaxID=546364 RepID=A0A1K1S1X5_9PSEU|nr:hypothetical protein SAMN04489730_4494 [Amycolatopsis australiensis]
MLSFGAALRNAAFRRSCGARYIAIPRVAWLGHRAPAPEPADDLEAGIEPPAVDEDLPEPSRKAFTRCAGAASALVYAVPTGALIGTPAGTAIAGAAGVFGWLTGRSLADEYYTRHHGDGPAGTAA